MEQKACSFIGHRKVEISDSAREKLIQTIENLIVKDGVGEFLFGSRSEFNDLCHLIVSGLRCKYPHIKRIMYTCKSETCILEKERNIWARRYKNLLNKDIAVKTFEEEREYKNKYLAGKSGYIQRNQTMIDDSSICIIYSTYKKPYKSGTAIAHNYLIKRQKPFINVAEF